MSIEELDALSAQNPAYQAADRELRPDLNLANDVIAFRVEQGLTQADLAKKIGTDQANISRLEGAYANPTLEFLKQVAQALDAELIIRLRRSVDPTRGPTSQKD